MDDDEQARAYAEADFEDANSRFIGAFRKTFGDTEIGGEVLDLGCGPGDIAMRFARAYPQCRITGVDGAQAMLRCGELNLAGAADIGGRVRFIHGMLPGARLPRETYDVVISNSLLHHLPDPGVMWASVKRFAAPGAPVFVMDLMRPMSRDGARAIVDQYAAGEPDVLREDFYNSLLAAFEPAEIESQLAEAGLERLAVRPISDRHVAIAGRMPAAADPPAL